MSNSLPRFLLGTSAALLLFGGAVHALAFKKAVAVFEASNLPVFYANASKGLWLIDSATLIIVAAVLALLTARPAMASGLVVAAVALIPAATSALLYCFVGAVMPAHLLLAAAALAFIAGLLLANGPNPMRGVKRGKWVD